MSDIRVIFEKGKKKFELRSQTFDKNPNKSRKQKSLNIVFTHKKWKKTRLNIFRSIRGEIEFLKLKLKTLYWSGTKS